MLDVRSDTERRLPESYQSIDQILGAKHGRYFGDGYKRVNYSLDDVRIDHLTRQLQVRACIEYPDSWSLKQRARTLKPHLSTIDAMLLNCYLCEHLLDTYFDLKAERHPPLLVRRVEMKSGSTPDEDLRAVPLEVTLLKSEKTVHEFYRYRSTLRVRVGVMELENVIEHGGDSRDTPADLWLRAWDDPRMSYSQECRRCTEHKRDYEIGAIELDLAAGCAKARLQIRQDAQQLNAFLSPIEVIVSLAQLAQALIYRSDNLDRSQSETLWMRSVLLENFTHFRDLSDSAAEVWLENEKTLRMGGETWRIFRMLGQVGSSRAVFTVAHKLPRALASN